MSKNTVLVPAKLPNGAEIHVEVQAPKEREAGVRDTLKEALSLDAVRETIVGVAQLVDSGFDKVKPDKVGVEFSIGLKVENDKLSALLLGVSGEGAIKISLEWTPRG